jgi:acyl-CoA synthetase (AMP-forming)/AMP-acid ligase II
MMVDSNLTEIGLGVDDLDNHISQSRKYLIGDVLRKAARSHGDKAAIVEEDGSQRTYADLNRRANALASSFLQDGIDHTSRVAVLSENRGEFLEVLYACAKIGALAPMLNWRQEEEELLHCLDIVDADIVIVSADRRDKLKLVKNSKIDIRFLSLDEGIGETKLDEFIGNASTDEPSPPREPTPEDGLCVFYTSGTTGLPKGAVMSHRALFYRALGWKPAAGIGPDYVAWPPMFHMGPTEKALTVAIQGGTLYPIDGFDPKKILRRVKNTRSTSVTILPGVINEVLATADELGYGPEQFEHVEYVGAMADLAGSEKVQEITRLFDADYVNTFGATETGVPPLTGNTIPAGTFPSKEDLSKAEGPIGAVRLVDDDWNKVSVGEEGELAIRGPTLFSGYIGNREANESDFHEGWFRTGDVLRRNEDGTYDFVDRKKYLIKSGGENIYPAEVEHPLVGHDSIDDAALVRIPDEKWGEVPKAYIALKEDAEMDGADVLSYLDGMVSRYKLPHYIEFVDKKSFPRSTTGKIIRNELEDWPYSSDERVRNP